MPRTQTTVRGRIGAAATLARGYLMGGAEGSTQPTVTPDTTTPQATREQAIEAIMAMPNGWSRDDAEAGIQFLHEMFERCRANNYQQVLPYTHEMQTVGYHVMDSFLPHGHSPAPGTTGHTVVDSLLDRKKGETGAWHDRREVDQVVHCTVGLCVGIIR